MTDRREKGDPGRKYPLTPAPTKACPVRLGSAGGCCCCCHWYPQPYGVRRRANIQPPRPPWPASRRMLIRRIPHAAFGTPPYETPVREYYVGRQPVIRLHSPTNVSCKASRKATTTVHVTKNTPSYERIARRSVETIRIYSTRYGYLLNQSLLQRLAAPLVAARS